MTKIPTKENLKQVLCEAAHKTIIQKTSYITSIWSKELSGLMKEETFEEIRNNCSATAKNIIKNLVCFEDGKKETAVLSNLKKYIKEADNRKRCLFMRFCTGSDIVSNNIQVTFTNTKQGFSRRPTSHVCSCEIVLDRSYSNYQELRSEMDAVLNADQWEMDDV